MSKKNKKHIVLVEDDPFLSRLLKRSLEEKGFQLELVQDGDNAVEAIKKDDLDLVLLDLCLPKQSGFETMKMLNDSTDPSDRPPIIIISNLSGEEDREKAKKLGAIQYYVKSKTSNDEIADRVSRYFQEHNGKEE